MKFKGIVQPSCFFFSAKYCTPNIVHHYNKIFKVPQCIVLNYFILILHRHSEDVFCRIIVDHLNCNAYLQCLRGAMWV